MLSQMYEYTGLYIIMYRCSCQILMKLEFFSTDFRKNIQISNFMKIRQVGAELFHAHGQTDRHDDANSRFLKF